MSASFDAYKIFYYVGKYRNITHAASALFLSQSTVSRSVQSLEAELGCKLFERTQQGVSFTIEGETLFGHISKACEQIFIGEEKVLQMQQLNRGGIRLGVSEFTFTQFVLPVLRTFHQNFPAVQIEIVSMGFNSGAMIIDALSSGKIDIACSAATFTEIAAPIHIDPVASYSDMVIAGNQFSELKNGSYFISDLVSYPFVSLISDAMNLSYLDKLFLAHGQSINPDFKVDSINMFIPLVKKCQCLAIVPTLFRDEFYSDDPVFEVKMKDPMPTHKVSILTSNSSPQSTVRDTFIKQLKSHIMSKVQGTSRSR